MNPFEELGQEVLPYRNQKHDHQREHDPSYWDPSQSKTYEQVDCLEDCEHGNCLERHRLHESGVVVLEDPAGVQVVNQLGELRIGNRKKEMNYKRERELD